MNDDLTRAVAPHTIVSAWYDSDSPAGWTIVGDLRTPGSDDGGMSDESNYTVADALRGKLEGVDFDPEFSCFFAHTNNLHDTLALIEALARWMHDDGRRWPS